MEKNIYIYFKKKYTGKAMTFELLLERLAARLRAMIENGETTERSFARRIGLSQPHLHNLLAGARSMTPRVADRILEGMELSAIDLLTEEERAGLAGPAAGERET